MEDNLKMVAYNQIGGLEFFLFFLLGFKERNKR